MRKLFIIIILLAGFVSCGEHQSHQHSHDGHRHEAEEHRHDCDQNHHEGDSEDDHDNIANSIVFTKEQSQKIGLETAIVALEPLYQVIRTTAQVIPTQDNEKIVTAKAKGIVSFTDKDLFAGKEIKAGQVLFSIESGNMADDNMKIRHEEIKAEYSRTKAEYERKQALAEDKLVSESELLSAQTDFLKAKKEYENMNENFPEGRQVVKSPITGFIKQTLVPNGSYVEAGQAVMTVAKSNTLNLKADIQPKYYPVLKDIKGANIKTLNNGMTYSLKDLSGRVISYGKAADISNPLIPVIFEIQNTIDLIPGSFVEMYIMAESNRQGIMVPNTAIVEEMGTYCVFIQHEAELYEKRLIEKGATDGCNTQIISGIEPGERIVTKGAVNVKLAQGSGALDPHAGHAH